MVLTKNFDKDILRFLTGFNRRKSHKALFMRFAGLFVFFAFLFQDADVKSDVLTMRFYVYTLVFVPLESLVPMRRRLMWTGLSW